MKKSLRILSMGLLVVALFGWTGSALGASSIVVAVDTPPRTMDGGGSLADATLSVLSNFYEPLVGRTGYEGKLIPVLAERYERIDPVSWKFHLRKGVKFHNGNPFTAADVKFTFERLTDPKCCSEFLDYSKRVDSIDILDDYTIVIKTKIPMSNYDQGLAPFLMMDEESTLSRDPGEIGQKPIGTGPYKLVEWVKGSYVKMAANEKYWGGAPPIKMVTLRPIKEASTRYAALVSGEVDLISGVPVELFQQVVKNPKLDVISRPSRRSIFLALGNKPGTPMADIRVRKAMYMAINEDEIVSKVMGGHAVPCAQVADSAVPGYVKDMKRLPYDPKQAAQLLKEAGYPEGFEITLAGPNDRYVQDEKICEAVAKYLTKIGIKVKLDVKPKALFFPEVVAGDKFDFYLIGWLDNSYDWGLTFNSIGYTFNKAEGSGTWNGTRYSDPDLDKLHLSIKKILNVEERVKTLQEHNRMAMEEKIFVIPLHYTVNTYAVRKSKGVQFTPRPDRWMIFKEISIK